MIGLTILAVLLMQMDKILLSKILSLENFGYYTLATTVVSALYVFTSPISMAFHPRLTQLLTDEDSTKLYRVYHQGSQLVTVLMGIGAVLLIFFGDRVLFVWTGDYKLVQQVTPILSVLVLATLLSGFALMPYHLQLASGWTSLRVKIDSFALIIMLPAIWLVVPNYGAIGAAWISFFLNAIRVFINVPLMHRRLLKTEQKQWFIRDVIIPFVSIFATGFFLSLVIPKGLGRLMDVVFLIVASLAMWVVAAISSELVGEHIRKLGSKIIGHLEVA